MPNKQTILLPTHTHTITLIHTRAYPHTHSHSHTHTHTHTHTHSVSNTLFQLLKVLSRGTQPTVVHCTMPTLEAEVAHTTGED